MAKSLSLVPFAALRASRDPWAEEALTNNVKRRLTMRYSLLLFSLVCVLVSMLVAYAGLKRQLEQSESTVNVFSVPSYRVEELEEAVAQIEVGVSTRADVNRLIGPYVDSRGRYRLKGTGADRDYFFVLRDRQLWAEFATGVDGVETVSRIGELEARAEWIRRWEGNYLTFSPAESPW